MVSEEWKVFILAWNIKITLNRLENKDAYLFSKIKSEPQPPQEEEEIKF